MVKQKDIHEKVSPPVPLGGDFSGIFLLLFVCFLRILLECPCTCCQKSFFLSSWLLLQSDDCAGGALGCPRAAAGEPGSPLPHSQPFSVWLCGLPAHISSSHLESRAFCIVPSTPVLFTLCQGQAVAWSYCHWLFCFSSCSSHPTWLSVHIPTHSYWGKRRTHDLSICSFFLSEIVVLDLPEAHGLGCRYLGPSSRSFISWLEGKEVWFQAQNVLILHGYLMCIDLSRSSHTCFF